MRLIISISGTIDYKDEGQSVLDAITAALLPFKELGLEISPKVTDELSQESPDE